MPSAEEDRRITEAAKDDPDAQPLMDEQLAAMVPIRKLRGRPPAASRKHLVSVRYSEGVLEYFRSTGPGWQSRMNLVLEKYVARQRSKRGPRGRSAG
jgi:uncharacterized protein (DUF4415 family)